MIVVKMTGGSGNRMFQCAAGLSAADSMETELITDNGKARITVCIHISF